MPWIAREMDSSTVGTGWHKRSCEVLALPPLNSARKRRRTKARLLSGRSLSSVLGGLCCEHVCGEWVALGIYGMMLSCHLLWRLAEFAMIRRSVPCCLCALS